MAEKIMADGVKPWDGIDVEALEKLAEDAKKDPRHVKNIKPLPNRKNEEEVPLLNCYFAPCQGGCPIHQDIPEYIGLAGEENTRTRFVRSLIKMPFRLLQELSAHITVCINVPETFMMSL